ncbi:hypothetical protein Trydic_g21669 [Trypoxylus dichotomus]
MLAIFRNVKVVILADFLQKWATITDAYYVNLISKLRGLIKERRRRKLRRGIVLFQDNAPSHKSVIATAAIHQVDYEIVGHPPYSIDLARNCFQNKEHLRSKRFSSNNDDFQIELLEHRWEICANLS